MRQAPRAARSRRVPARVRNRREITCGPRPSRRARSPVHKRRTRRRAALLPNEEGASAASALGEPGDDVAVKHGREPLDRGDHHRVPPDEDPPLVAYDAVQNAAPTAGGQRLGSQVDTPARSVGAQWRGLERRPVSGRSRPQAAKGTGWAPNFLKVREGGCRGGTQFPEGSKNWVPGVHPRAARIEIGGAGGAWTGARVGVRGCRPVITALHTSWLGVQRGHPAPRTLTGQGGPTGLVGGVPEVVRDGETGFLVPMGTSVGSSRAWTCCSRILARARPWPRVSSGRARPVKATYLTAH